MPNNSFRRIARVVQLTQTVALVLVVSSTALLYESVRDFRTADRWVDHTHEVLDEIDEVRNSVLRGGLALRNFTLSAQPLFLDRLSAAADESALALRRLEAKVAVDPAQAARATEASAETVEILGWYRSSRVIAERDGPEALRRSMHARVSIDASQRLREVLDEMEVAERKTLSRRRAERDGRLDAVKAGAGVAVALFVGFILWTIAYASRLVGVGEAGIEQLSANADRDPLTGLANRRALDRRVDELSGQPFAVIVCDLDSFKPVNDQHGHAAGDEVLRAVAARLMQQCRDKDLVVRPGGDEFVVVLPGLLSEERLRAIAARIGLAIGEPVSLESGATVRVGASIGFASTPGDIPVDALMRDADAMSYAEKRRQKAAAGERIEADGH